MGCASEELPRPESVSPPETRDTPKGHAQQEAPANHPHPARETPATRAPAAAEVGGTSWKSGGWSDWRSGSQLQASSWEDRADQHQDERSWRPSRETLVIRIKDFQKRGVPYKQAWQRHIHGLGSNTYDPNRHPDELLASFVRMMDAGDLDSIVQALAEGTITPF